ncbi:MAG TPA: cytochrome c [Deltaproteobacteria bacterium]|nr:cytochrome c [Deltaproteobacteria bacterium]
MSRWIGVCLLGLAGCAGDEGITEDTGTLDRVAAVRALTGDEIAGGALYDSNCSVCHGADGSGTSSGPNIRGEGGSEAVEAMLFPEDSMPSFDHLADQELADISAYVSTL